MTISPCRSLFAEFMGTAMLVGVVIGSGIMGDTLSQDTAIALWGNTAATGAILVVLILILGPISGAHFNPAVTLAFRLRGDISTALMCGYIVAQIVGGCAGAILANIMFDLPAIDFPFFADQSE